MKVKKQKTWTRLHNFFHISLGKVLVDRRFLETETNVEVVFRKANCQDTSKGKLQHSCQDIWKGKPIAFNSFYMHNLKHLISKPISML